MYPSHAKIGRFMPMTNIVVSNNIELVIHLFHCNTRSSHWCFNKVKHICLWMLWRNNITVLPSTIFFRYQQFCGGWDVFNIMYRVSYIFYHAVWINERHLLNSLATLLFSHYWSRLLLQEFSSEKIGDLKLHNHLKERYITSECEETVARKN